MLSRNFSMIGSPINLITRLLINTIAVCIIVKSNTVLSHLWKLFQMALMNENYGTYITEPDNSYVKIWAIVVSLR